MIVLNESQFDYQLGILAELAGVSVTKDTPAERALGMCRASIDAKLQKLAPGDALGARVVKGMSSAMLLECCADTAAAILRESHTRRQLAIVEHARTIYAGAIIDLANDPPREGEPRELRAKRIAKEALLVATTFADEVTQLLKSKDTPK